MRLDNFAYALFGIGLETAWGQTLPHNP
jgi:hypothetical protein